MRKERTCSICEECERLRLQAGDAGIRIEKERPIGFICTEHGRFVLFGPLPKDRRAVDQLARDLKLQLGMTKPPGPKAKNITFYDVCIAYAGLPFDASLQTIADTMDVPRNKVSKTLEKALSSIGELREMRRSGEKSVLSSRRRKANRRKQTT